MEVIAVVNQKGGSGKSSTSTIIAKSIADTGKKVLIIDTDPQGGITSLLLPKIPAEEKRKGIYDILVGEDPEFNINVVLTNHSTVGDRLYIIPSDHRFDLIYSTISPFVLKQCLEDFASKNFDVVIIDTPPTVQGITRSAILFADKIIVPCEISQQAHGPTEYTINEILNLDKTPNIVYIGWQEPDPKGEGLDDRNGRLFKETFDKFVIGNLPKNKTNISFASEDKKITDNLRNVLLSNAISIVGKAS
ncbi:CobQ/CobB/MinD/ParA nucleotide binding domain protein [Leptospira santarosai str. HAI134]|uniref:ParA family protein n=1 Tax=Leptospira santarosai TaxID=28183 RepID=UPI0002BF7C50|nr:AAA family ATPase [Leptospira santarosai]EMO20667.1 CobQ/CobB/MinD/ParA nucleotide binding domain protein [Leptospira santarosai str. HAI134]